MDVVFNAVPIILSNTAFWTTVCETVSPYAIGQLSDCLVTLVYCGQTIGWIKMLLATQVGLDQGDIVLDGDPALPSPRKAAQQPTTFRPMSIVAKRSPILATAELLFYYEVKRAFLYVGYCMTIISRFCTFADC